MADTASSMAQPSAAREAETVAAPALARPRRGSSDWKDLLAFAVLAALLGLLVLRGATSMDYNWQWSRITPYLVRNVDGELIAGTLLKGLRVTLEISAMAIVIALPIGLATALFNLSRSPVAILLARVYIELIRNTPILCRS